MGHPYPHPLYKHKRRRNFKWKEIGRTAAGKEPQHNGPSICRNISATLFGFHYFALSLPLTQLRSGEGLLGAGRRGVVHLFFFEYLRRQISNWLTELKKLRNLQKCIFPYFFTSPPCQLNWTLDGWLGSGWCAQTAQSTIWRWRIINRRGRDL